MNMQIRHGWYGTGLLFLVALAAPCTPALADSNTYVTPSFSVGRGYDDNLFFTPTNEKSDSFWRFSPALEAGFESESLALGGYYTVDAERYAEFKDLDSNVARRNGALKLKYQATQRLQLLLDGNYISTNTPSEISPGTGLAIGRARAKVYSVAPSLTYEYSALTTIGAGYRDVRQVLAGSPDTDLRSTMLRLSRQLGDRDTLHAHFTNDIYDFDTFGSVTSRAFTLGWAHAATANTSFSIAAGPRDTEGDISAELSASLRHALESGTVSIDYFRTQTEVLGQPAPVDAHIFSILVDYALNPAIDIQVAPSVVRNSVNASDADVYRLNLHGRFKLSDMLSLIGSYQYNLQKGVLGGASDVRISDNVIYVGVAFTFHPSQSDIFKKRQIPPFETLWPAPRH